MVDELDRRPGEPTMQWANRLARGGHADEMVRYQLTVSAGTLAELERRVAPGADAQDLTLMAIGHALIAADGSPPDVE